MFAFDDLSALYDVTPVENLFIQEYLPHAKGDYVKVYLYGLMACYRPNEDLTLTQMARDLDLTEKEVQAAYRYWERRGLCHRVSDNPPAYRYASAKQRMFAQQTPPPDPAYEAFAEALHAAFGESRKLHGGETALAYEWVEEMHLPPEAVILMIHHLIETRGVNFTFKAANKVAVRMAKEKVQSAEDAELFIARDHTVRANTRQILSRLGQRRLPSEDEMDLCQKWMYEYGFTLEDMLAACAETTKGAPTMGYLNGILEGIYKRSGGKKTAADQLRQDKAQQDPVKALLQAMGAHKLTVNESTKAAYEQFRQLASHEVILLAGRQVALSGGDMADVLTTLNVLKAKGLTDVDEVERYFHAINAQNQFILSLMEIWGRKDKPTPGDRTLLSRWMSDWGFTQEALLALAPLAQSAQRPMAYLDAILEAAHQKGLTDPAAIQAARELSKPAKPAAPAKTVTQQQYTQRPHREDDLAGLNDLMKEYNQ